MVKLVCVTKFMHSRVEWISTLLTFNLMFKYRFTVMMLSYCDAWLPVYSKRFDRQNLCASLLYFVVCVRCRRKRVHVCYLIFWWAFCVVCGINSSDLCFVDESFFSLVLEVCSVSCFCCGSIHMHTMSYSQKLVDYFVISGLNISSGLEPDQLSGYSFNHMCCYWQCCHQKRRQWWWYENLDQCS